MRRLALVASASFALFALGACDDDDPKKPDAGRDGGSDGVVEAGTGDGGPTMCVGTFATTNRATLGAAVNAKPTGMCKAAADLDLICTADLGGKFRGVYAQTCLPFLSTGIPTVVSCLEQAVSSEHPTLSAGCRGCYVTLVSCTLTNCRETCPANPSSPACMMCQQNSGCLPNFFACTGLPGGAPTTDGGAPDMPASDGGVDTGTADTSVDTGTADTSADTAADTGSDI